MSEIFSQTHDLASKEQKIELEDLGDLTEFFSAEEAESLKKEGEDNKLLTVSLDKNFWITTLEKINPISKKIFYPRTLYKGKG